MCVLLLLLLLFCKFFTPASPDSVSQWSLSDSKSSQVSRTLLSILANINIVFRMVFCSSLISKTSIHCTNTFVTILRAPITIGLTYYYYYHYYYYYYYYCLNLESFFTLVLVDGFSLEFE